MPRRALRKAKQYHLSELTEAEAGRDPIQLFLRWFAGAKSARFLEPEAFALATATPDGRPSVRFVLLKHCDERGFVFFSNYQSRKGRELDANPWAALAVHWDKLERQVRIEGRVEPTTDEESDDYFRSRLLVSRLGTWASRQSAVIRGRTGLERRLKAAQKRFPGAEVPRPPHWGGYRLKPERIEFWQGRPNRLHDRILFTRRARSGWKRERLSP